MTNNIEQMILEVEKIDNQIFEVNQTIAPQVIELNNKKEELKEKLDLELAKIASEELKEKEYGCGTSNIDMPMHKVKVVISKKIKWDEKELFNIRQQILDAGQDSSVYIKEKLSVTETAYNSFPDKYKEVFKTARTVEPSVPKITIERKQG